jgi:hypothetical protein
MANLGEQTPTSEPAHPATANLHLERRVKLSGEV